MADDLDDFLKQAAQRRQQRQQQKNNRPPVVQPVAEQSRSAPPRLQQQDPIPSAQVVDSKPYTPTVGNLSSSLPSASRDNSIDQADERMQAHVQQVFQHEISSLRQSEQKPSPKKKQKRNSDFKRLQQPQPKYSRQPKYLRLLSPHS